MSFPPRHRLIDGDEEGGIEFLSTKGKKKKGKN